MTANLNKKPPTQVAGVTGIDAHGSMGEAPTTPSIDWWKLTHLPSFEMFVLEQSGFTNVNEVNGWVNNRREALGDDKLYDLYADWHKQTGLWPKENPMGELIEGAE